MKCHLSVPICNKGGEKSGYRKRNKLSRESRDKKWDLQGKAPCIIGERKHQILVWSLYILVKTNHASSLVGEHTQTIFQSGCQVMDVADLQEAISHNPINIWLIELLWNNINLSLNHIHFWDNVWVFAYHPLYRTPNQQSL